MRTIVKSIFVIFILLLAANISAHAEDLRDKAQELYRDGNYKDAYEIYKDLVLGSEVDNNHFSSDLSWATSCLNSLGKIEEIDSLLEEGVEKHPDSWPVLFAVGSQYSSLSNFGSIVAGKFYRGSYRNGGRYVDSSERDRVRALQLLVKALKLTERNGARTNFATNFAEVAPIYWQLAEALSRHRNALSGWKLQHLTDLSHLPDYDDSQYAYGQSIGAPVDDQGEPLYYKVPETFETAKNDGERFRWALSRYAGQHPSYREQVQYYFAEFMNAQFGVGTLVNYGYFRRAGDDSTESLKSRYDLHTLKDNETIAKLATGIKRFTLPDEFNAIKLFGSLADTDENSNRSSYAESASDSLCRIFENRRQFDRAGECWKKAIKYFGKGSNEQRQKSLDQIYGAWGQFEPVETQPASGQGSSILPTIEYRFRNGTGISLEAREIKIDKLLADIQSELENNPRAIDYQKVNIDYLGYQLVQRKAAAYLGERVASWTQELKPRENHFDSRVTISTPLKKAGAYFVTARISGGNESNIVVWVADAAIVKKPLNDGNLFYLSDARNGIPLSDVDVKFFGYKTEQITDNSLINKATGRTFNVVTARASLKSDSNGLVYSDKESLPPGYQWLATANTSDGKRAFLGFSYVWYGRYYDAEYNQVKVFPITDRPVYRPAQTVKLKLWIANAKYDEEGRSSYAERDVTVQIHDPKGEKVFEKSLRADGYGGVEWEFPLPKDATLGVYTFGASGVGLTGSFRVEEYKKPEFEVKVEAPSEPITLGDKFTAKIQAKYYFGAPVTEAKVKYKVLRSGFEASWYPTGIWDWLYGAGYWWFAYDYRWFPGWSNWGCRRPIPWWWISQKEQPEVVLENEVPIGKDGTVSVEIDSSIAKELHGDEDHRYQIFAEVTDQSRRVIDGSGEVLAARKPFKVYTWVNRGHYRVGDVIHAEFLAQTVASKPVQGKGTVKLFKISYEKEKVKENSVQEWKLDTDQNGRAELQIKSAAAGQYRLSFTVQDKAGHSIEGGYLLNVIGEGFDKAGFRFNDVELIPEKREYNPGETVRLMLNTNAPDSTVLLFIRPSNGIYLKPEVIHLHGKSVVHEIGVVKKDMPNFFVEALTVNDGKVFSEVKEIVVPPEKRVLNVDVQPSKDKFKPGEMAKVKFKLTDLQGSPFVGAAALTVYDKALEYISAGSNVPEIKSFFWKWRRTHRTATESSLDRVGVNLVTSDVPNMLPIGIFGATVADDEEGGRAGKDGLLRTSEFAGAKNVKTKGGRVFASMSSAVGGMARDNRSDASSFLDKTMPASEMNNEALVVEPQSAPAPAQEGQQSTAQQPIIRKEFADTAYWNGSLQTNQNGEAEVEFKMPENLSEWKVKVWGIGNGSKVGEGDSAIVTTKNVIIRLQTPRFLVERDEVVISGNVHNYLSTEQKIEAKIELDSELLKLMDPPSKQLVLKSKEEARVDWRVKVLAEGDARVRVLALGGEESDATELKIPVKVHGILKTESFSGALSPEKSSGELKFAVPSERRIDQSRLEIRYSPSLAAAMVDALPYMVNYPYGCTEQTLNRFLPTVITQKILREMKLDLRAIRDKRTNLNAQEIGNDKDRAKQWKRYEENPVFDEDKVAEMTEAGLDRLLAMQQSDGGWGWFSGYGETSSPHTTAQIVHGLQIARETGVSVDNESLSRGIGWLHNYQANEIQELKNASTKTKPYKEKADDLDAFIYMVLTDEGKSELAMRDFLFRDKNHLSVYTKAMFGLALLKNQDSEKLAAVMKNLEQYLVKDDENQTAYLKFGSDHSWWYWHGSEIEADSYYLKLLAHAAPKGDIAPRLVKYLLNNRKHATYWNSTRDTAIAIEALADYLKKSGELEPNLTVSIFLDGKKLKEEQITKENLFTFENTFIVEGEALTSGPHRIEVKKAGRGPLYYNAYLSNFTLEDFITKAGLEIKVNRKLYKLTPSDEKALVAGSRGQALEQKIDKYVRAEISSDQMLKSGDLVEVELEIDSKNDYEYLIFEDLKAAGFEPVDVRSGYNNNDLRAYVEYRDDRVAFFSRNLSRGKHSVSYRVRAEIPGHFSALPTLGYAMYAPELKANSDEIKIRIED